jgi:glyoxylase-like metal-dependent hydrolase (beta-lactamase superfamily II)
MRGFVRMAADGVLVVDTTVSPDHAIHVIDGLHQRVARPIDVVINTHHHGTHSYGNIAFKGKTAVLLAHENSKKKAQFDLAVDGGAA